MIRQELLGASCWVDTANNTINVLTHDFGEAPENYIKGTLGTDLQHTFKIGWGNAVILSRV